MRVQQRFVMILKTSGGGETFLKTLVLLRRYRSPNGLEHPVLTFPDDVMYSLPMEAVWLICRTLT
jgi:hypothetical protein